ncbi:unnamed protein product [Dovyalis caffra]|uniref:RNase H type-1 domain-containing protein n=1 Tax=Dovyalis caffra TaxID=77055 RepID=A0AAV1RTA6_9ROSI|nr:unnamed protein product [Dovyalis caffra]
MQQGLHHAWELGFRNIILKVDWLEQEALHMVREANPLFRPCHALVADISELVKRKNFILQKCSCSQRGNSCADIMAKLGASGSNAFVEWSDPPWRVLQALHGDARDLKLNHIMCPQPTIKCFQGVQMIEAAIIRIS